MWVDLENGQFLNLHHAVHVGRKDGKGKLVIQWFSNGHSETKVEDEAHAETILRALDQRAQLDLGITSPLT